MTVNNASCLSACLMTLTLSLSALPASAKNISQEQNDAYQARETYHQNKSKLQSLTGSIAQQEVRVANEQAKLDALKAEQTAAQHALTQSKADLDAKVERLNAVWDERD